MRRAILFFLLLISGSSVGLAQGGLISRDMDPNAAELADRKAKYQQADQARTSGDLAKAAKLYRAAVETGWTTASLEYDEALNYSDDAEPVKWFRALAESGNPDAEFLLARAYSRGRTVPANAAEALKWYTKLANQGDAEAQYEVGEAYQLGQGVKQSNVEAKKWFKKSAAQGNERAQFILNKMKSKGD